MSEEDFIPLLSGKPLCRFTPEEYKTHVKALYFKRAPKKSVAKKKRLRDYMVKVKRLKKGTLSVTTTRNPKYVTAEEYDKLSLEFRENELFIAIKAAGVKILSSHEEAEKMK